MKGFVKTMAVAGAVVAALLIAGILAGLKSHGG